MFVVHLKQFTSSIQARTYISHYDLITFLYRDILRLLRSNEPQRSGGVLSPSASPEESLLQRDIDPGGRLFLPTVWGALHGLREGLSSRQAGMPSGFAGAFQSSHRSPRRKHGLRCVREVCQVRGNV